jgi:8-oxo-dGTP diphosphatase
LALEREYPDRPLVGVGAIVHSEGKILLIQRAKEPNRGLWIIPGGLVELGEGLEKAVVREVKEELGIDVSVESLLGVASEMVVDESNKVKYHYVLIDFVVAPLQNEIVLNEESDDYGWFSPETALSIRTTDNIRNMIRRYVAFMAASSADASRVRPPRSVSS